MLTDIDEGSYQHLGLSRDGDILTVVIRQRNHATHTELSRIFSDLRFDRSRVVILTGEGDSFLGPPNLPEFATVDEHVWQRLMREAKAMVRDSLEIPQALIVALNGDAIGLGASVLSVADFVVAASGTVVRESHLRMGIAAGDGGTLTLPVLLGLHRAKRFFLLDEPITVEDLCELGIVYQVVERDLLLTAARQISDRLLELPRPALEWTKASLNRVLHQAVLVGLDSAVAHEGWSWHLEAAQSQIRELQRTIASEAADEPKS
jgi:enoyl-CoA hydratase